MKNRDLQELPKYEDCWTYLYFEKGLIDQHGSTVGYHFLEKVVPIPIESLAILMLGPGISITHEAVKRISECRCLIAWTGEQGVRMYCFGNCRTYSARNLLKQAEIWANLVTREKAVRTMYQKRFHENVLNEDYSIEQLRGMEGARVRKSYGEFSELYGVEWEGRHYKQEEWNYADPLNRALSSAHACLYGIVHAAILACGLSPGIGFVHTGKQLSFVYDIADLYKTDTTIPIAFETVKEGTDEIERRVRYRCRDKFKECKIMNRIIPDLKDVIYGSDYDGEIEALPEGRDVAVSY
ncbi:MAG: type I-E CRISPR-associated endonuclease Cas1 [Brevinematales bacterium]|nr:type I-E CRISPR-associated endonuclease Cas1 [Brevinematales bacterium]